ncbi:hypothetical protein F5Y07DRAFT_351583 [Xylaria sp. FL0933]|nr:hypothetical protein F5Y07DRAFT_351583 [Xylaria sp. FL0933]
MSSRTIRLAHKVPSIRFRSKLPPIILCSTGPVRAHWNSPFKPEEYNFFQHAVSKGYPVFFYDRLGKGKSDNYTLGAYISHYTIALQLDLFDAAVLAGVNYNTSVINTNGLVRSFVPRVASLQNTDRFGEFDTGYLIWVDGIANINT